jgi:hypothetical protein
MIGPTRTRVLSAIAACALCLLLALPAAQAFGEEAAITYTKESLPAYEQQLAAGQIASVTINKRLRSLRITLKDGSHVLAHYAAKQEPEVSAALKAKGVSVVVLSPAAAKKEASKAPVHHKLRYIAGGILIAVVVIVGGVLFWDRRRKRLAE